MSDFSRPEEIALNPIQPVTDDFSTDGYLNEFAKVDHQHPLSQSLRDAIFNPPISTVYIKKSGDTMGGQLVMSSSVNPSLYLPGAGEQVRFGTAAAYMSWYNGTTRIGYLQGASSGMILSSENSQVLTLSGAGGIVGNGYSLTAGVVGNRWVATDANGYIMGNYFNCTANTVAAGNNMDAVAGRHGGDNYIRWYGTPQLYRWVGYSGSNQWNTCGLGVVPTVGVASICFHTGGAPQIGSNAGFGNNLYFRDGYWGAGTSNLYALGYVGDSSRRWKKNINQWPLQAVGAAVESALDLVTKLNPITFQPAPRDIEIPTLRRQAAADRLNSYKVNKGDDPYELPEHDCKIHDCVGTADSPCIRHINHNKERIGMIAEEVYKILPQAVFCDDKMEPVGIEYSQLTVAAIAAIKELTQRVLILEGNASGTDYVTNSG